MKNNKNIILVILSGLFFMTTLSCVELEENPVDFTGPDNYYNTPAQVESAFTAAGRRIFRRWGIFQYNGRKSVYAGTDQYRGGDLAYSEEHGNRVWRDLYKSIADINPAIGAMNSPDSPISENDKKGLMGQARFLRAFSYFYLVRLYGDVPIIAEDTDVINSDIVRNPIADVYDFIVADLLYASENLPDSWPGSPAKITADGAKGLLAKVYLTMATAPLKATENFAKARDMALQVINGRFDLHTNVEDVFLLENQNGKEVLFSMNYVLGSGDHGEQPAVWLPGHMGGWGDHTANRVWFLAYPEQPRRHAYLLMEDWDGIPYTDFPNGESYHIRKYINIPREDLEANRTSYNFPLLRFADVLLIFAEAENMVNGGPTQAAVDAVNRIIDRANGYVDNPFAPKVTTGMSQKAFDDAVIQERNLELCFELDRWFDLVRKEILCEVQEDYIQVNCSPEDYLMPIPQVDLRLNPLMKQNPGYPAPGGDE